MGAAACAIWAPAQQLCLLLAPQAPFPVSLSGADAWGLTCCLCCCPSPPPAHSLPEIQAALGRRGRVAGSSWRTWHATRCRTGRTRAPPTCRVRRGSLPRCPPPACRAHRSGSKAAAGSWPPLQPLRPRPLRHSSPSQYMTGACCRAQEGARGKLSFRAAAAAETEARTGRARMAVSELALRAQLRAQLRVQLTSERSNEWRAVRPPRTFFRRPPLTCCASGGRLLRLRAKGAFGARRGSCETSG
jgi:hypothetical protein